MLPACAAVHIATREITARRNQTNICDSDAYGRGSDNAAGTVG
jgi:hypothetical protein